MWIDSHCHLDAAEFDHDRDAVIERARAAGVGLLVVPAVCPASFDAARQAAIQADGAYALGIHPLFVPRVDETALAQLREALARHRDDPRLVAIGEIGLDHFVPELQGVVQRERQYRFYTAQLDLAIAFDLPVILHVRRSADHLLKALRQRRAEGRPVRGGIAHAFNGSEQQARAFVDLGFKLGFGGAMTFDRALQIRRLAQTLPAQALVLETDAPDIVPHWLYRTAQERSQGQTSRNEPAELPRIAQAMAELRACSLGELARLTSANAVEALPGLQAVWRACKEGSF